MPKPLPSRGDIVAALASEPRALHAREIAARFKLPESAYSRLLELLERLSFDGTLRRSGNRFKAQPEIATERGKPKGGGWDGRLGMHPRGFGFVTAPGREDVYVAPDGIGAALHGDRVEVGVVGRSSRGTEGRIERILERRNPRVAGLLRRKRKSAWLEPDDTRIRGPIVLDGPLPPEARDGMAAVVTITRFPEGPTENPEGEVLMVLGTPGEANVEVQKILVREQIQEAHPEDALREAEAAAARLSRPGPDGRVDLREVPLLTIDPEDARDHDDAVFAERTENGFRVVVGIADVAEYVSDGTALDQEARRRGCTIYLPDRAVPMLPSGLAADLCSLLPDRDRYCLAVIAELDRRGAVLRFEVVEGVMRAAAMISYGGAARALGYTSEPPVSPAADRFKRELKVLDEVSRKLRFARLRRGALDFDLPEAKIVLDEKTGAPTDVVKRAEDPGVKKAYQIIEELMILSNELVADWLGKRQSPAIYRVHGKPDEQKLERLVNICERLGAPVELEQLLEPRGIASWLETIQEHPKRAVLESVLLRSMKQAVYDTVNVGHFGLASGAYLHFTSPIRRYPDLRVHRAVKRLLRGGKPDKTPEGLEQLRADAGESSARERAAMEVEREVADLYRALFMRDHIGEVFDGVVSGVTGSGLYVSLDHPFVDVLVRFESLGPDSYEVTDDDLGVVGVRSGDAIGLGDRVTVTVEDVVILRRTVLGRRVVPERALPKGRGAGKGAERGRSDHGEARRAPRRPQAERAQKGRHPDDTRGREKSGRKSRRVEGKRGRR